MNFLSRSDGIVVPQIKKPDAFPLWSPYVFLSGVGLFMALYSLICSSIVLCGCKEKPIPPAPEWTPGEIKLSGTAHILPFTNIFNDACQQYQYDGQPTFLAVYRSTSTACYEINPTDITPPLTVNIYFIRHGESTWNVAHGSSDPLHRDAHLTTKGVDQALKLSDSISKGHIGGSKQDKEILNGKPVIGRKIIYATSNLRRAAFTFLLSFQHLIRMKKSSPIKKLYILSALQEVCGNMDCNTLSPPGQIPKLTFGGSGIPNSGTDYQCPFEDSDMRAIMDPSCNDGDELIKAADNGQKAIAVALNHFCTWIRNMAVSEHATDFVIAGHSIFVRRIFQAMLPDKLPQNDIEKSYLAV